jgi:hypothetical protein
MKFIKANTYGGTHRDVVVDTGAGLATINLYNVYFAHEVSLNLEAL